MEVRVQCHYDSTFFQRDFENFLIGSLTHTEFADVPALISATSQKNGAVSRNSLVQHEAHR